MPFIVTTKRLDSSTGWADSGLRASRRTVATLEEARETARQSVVKAGVLDAQWGTALIPESGGTVGPLPDGTTIEVEQISPLMLASRIGASGEEVMSCLRADDFGPLIAAFNARGASGDA